MWPKSGVDFPYSFFGVEVKRGYNGMGAYNRALKQASDYTQCKVIGVYRGDEIIGSRFAGERIERVFVYPGADEKAEGVGYGWVAGVNRLAGLYYVGMIYDATWRPGPFFYMSAMRIWDPSYRTNRCTPQRQLIGSGVNRHSTTLNLAELFPESFPKITPIRRI